MGSLSNPGRLILVLALIGLVGVPVTEPAGVGSHRRGDSDPQDFDAGCVLSKRAEVVPVARDDQPTSVVFGSCDDDGVDRGARPCECSQPRGAASKKLQDQLYQTMEGRGLLRLLNVEVNTLADQAGKWEQDADGKIRMVLSVRFTLRKGPFEIPVYPHEANVMLESQQPIDPAKFNEDSPAPDWKLLSLEINSVMAVMDKK